MKGNLRHAVWYTVTLSGIVFAITILSTIQGAPLWGWLFTSGTALLQLIGLVYYLHSDPYKEKPRWLKFLLRLLQLSVLAVVFLLGLSIYALASQYHNLVLPTETESGKNITIVENDELYIMYPQFDTVEFVTKDRPSRGNEHITYCSGATFQRTYNLFFSRDDLAAIHVEDGTIYRGYTEEGLGAFTYYDGTFHFANSAEAQEKLETAAKRGGCGFQQYLIIDDGQIVSEPADEYRCFRVLAELNGELCVIDSRKQIEFHDFAVAVQKLGVTHALYMDMGSGWNYSWYRGNDGKANTLIGLPWPFSHNWLTFVCSE